MDADRRARVVVQAAIQAARASAKLHPMPVEGETQDGKEFRLAEMSAIACLLADEVERRLGHQVAHALGKLLDACEPVSSLHELQQVPTMSIWALRVLEAAQNVRNVMAKEST